MISTRGNRGAGIYSKFAHLADHAGELLNIDILCAHYKKKRLSSQGGHIIGKQIHVVQAATRGTGSEKPGIFSGQIECACPTH